MRYKNDFQLKLSIVRSQWCQGVSLSVTRFVLVFAITNRARNWKDASPNWEEIIKSTHRRRHSFIETDDRWLMAKTDLNHWKSNSSIPLKTIVRLLINAAFRLNSPKPEEIQEMMKHVLDSKEESKKEKIKISIASSNSNQKAQDITLHIFGLSPKRQLIHCSLYSCSPFYPLSKNFYHFSC